MNYVMTVCISLMSANRPLDDIGSGNEVIKWPSQDHFLCFIYATFVRKSTCRKSFRMRVSAADAVSRIFVDVVGNFVDAVFLLRVFFCMCF